MDSVGYDRLIWLYCNALGIKISFLMLDIIRSLNVKQPAESIHSVLSTFDSEEIAWDVYI